MQPLDKAFMSPFKTYYAQAIEKWLEHPGRKVTIYQIGENFGEVFAKAATDNIAVNGFRGTGLFPVNQNFSKNMSFSARNPLQRLWHLLKLLFLQEYPTYVNHLKNGRRLFLCPVLRAVHQPFPIRLLFSPFALLWLARFQLWLQKIHLHHNVKNHLLFSSQLRHIKNI